MQISVKPILKSAGANHFNIVTLELNYPRFIHGEIMTHRVFSRNAMSSRAIPVTKMIEQVQTDPVMPVSWGKNQKGMQADEVVDEGTAHAAERIWTEAAENAARSAAALADLGIHKQLANRLLEPFQWMRTIVTSTEWANFLNLRDHKDAEPHFQVLASEVRKVLEVGSGWQKLKEGEWHLPYLSAEEITSMPAHMACKVSAARCARVSYLTHDGRVPNVEEDLQLFERLAGGVPIHASPLEHQAMSVAGPTEFWSGNFRGFVQYRKVYEKSLAGGV